MVVPLALRLQDCEELIFLKFEHLQIMWQMLKLLDMLLVDKLI